MRTNHILLLIGWHNVKILAITPASLPVYHVMAPSCCGDLESHDLLLVATLLVFMYYSHYIRTDLAGAEIVCLLTMSDFSVFNLTAFHARLVMVLCLLKAVLLCPVSGILVCCCPSHLLSVRL